jgi:hypothetical protein
MTALHTKPFPISKEVSDFVDKEYPKGHPDRGLAILAIVQFLLWRKERDRE